MFFTNNNREFVSEKNIVGIRESLYERLFTLEQTGIDPKIYAYWRRHGLIDFVEKGDWAKFGYVQFIWLRILNTLREFGCNLPLLKKVHYYLFESAFEENLAKRNLEDHQQHLEAKMNDGLITEEEKFLLIYINEILEDEELLYILRRDISYLSHLIVESLDFGGKTGFYLFPNGNIIVSCYGELWAEIESEVTVENPHIFIPIAHYIAEFIAEDEKFEFIKPLDILSDDELEIIKAIRQKDIKKLEITIKEEEIKRINAIQEGVIKSEDAKKIMEMLGLKNYEEIVLKTVNEKTLSFKKTKKFVK